LVAEDDAGIRKLARLIFESLGYRVLEASDGQEALALAQQHTGPLQLLVTDIIMPRVGGRELAERLRALRPALRILYLSGYSDETLDHQGLPGEGLAFLQKPFTPMTLARRVREVLEAGQGEKVTG
jgi:CheY-like chemotaxis protein